MTVKEEARKKYDFYKEIFSLRVQGKLKKAPYASHYDLPAASTQESSTEVSSTQPFLPEAFAGNGSQPLTNWNPNFHQWTPQQNLFTFSTLLSNTGRVLFYCRHNSRPNFFEPPDWVPRFSKYRSYYA
eukprot:GHVP01044263.1.p1 GENE.GHVP01044263.1~~GHVP01044263.1.p1  ORF type:complete len:128 (-),score=7.41 GHVP01044263.1:369-752(-)